MSEEEFVGYGPAAEYLGLKRNTLSAYCSQRVDPVTGRRRGPIGPRVAERRVIGSRVMPVFTRDDLDRWKDERPGQGARTDLIEKAHAEANA